MSAVGRDGTRVLLYGSLWGIAVAAFYGAELPLSQMEPERVAAFMLAQMPLLAISGTCIAVYGRFAARHLSRGATVAGALLATPLVVALDVFVLREILSPLFDLDLHVIRTERPLLTHVLVALWQIVILGGLLLTACVWAERSARTRTLLAQAEIARGLAATQLGETQLQALQADIDPAFLQRVLAKVKLTYATRPADADRLLDELVAFLRAAMPAVRTGQSTLADELRLAEQVAKLHNQLDDGGPCRVVEVRGTPPDDVPLPPLLLRLIEQLAKSAPRGSTVRLVADCSEHQVTLALHAARAGPWLDDPLEYRLRVGLRALYGAQATLRVHEQPEAGAVALAITLPLNPAAGATSAAHSTPDPEGEPRWTIPVTT
jgi:hypothetical protein